MRVASEVGWGTFLPNLGTLDLWVLELFAMYANGRTDRRADKSNVYCPLPCWRGVISLHARPKNIAWLWDQTVTSWYYV